MNAAHHDKLAPYADMAQAAYGAKLAAAHLRNALVDGMPVDRACAVQGAHNALGFGLSFLPHDHASSAAAATVVTGGDEGLAVALESAFASSGPAESRDWSLVVAILVKLLERWLAN